MDLFTEEPVRRWLPKRSLQRTRSEPPTQKVENAYLLELLIRSDLKLVAIAMATPGEVVIAVLGVTGAGKSSLVKRVTNRNDIYIEDGLSSGTVILQLDCMLTPTNT